MDEDEMRADWLADRFEEHRPHLRSVAYRMLGSMNEADDAVQDTWLRVSRAGASEVENLGGWLTTIVARVCLNMLRPRGARYPLPSRAAYVRPPRHVRAAFRGDCSHGRALPTGSTTASQQSAAPGERCRDTRSRS